MTALAAKKIEITAEAAEIPAGVDGEAVPLPPSAARPISPGVRRAWVPRDRPVVSAPKPSVNRPRLRHLADARRERAGADTTAVSASPEPAMAWRTSSIWYRVQVDR